MVLLSTRLRCHVHAIDISCSDIFLRACYAVSGTDLCRMVMRPAGHGCVRAAASYGPRNATWTERVYANTDTPFVRAAFFLAFDFVGCILQTTLLVF
eukprot:3059749-Rhodomonas_salina.2